MNNQQFLLLKLAEEAIEIAHMAHKCIQFGMEEHHPSLDKSNKERLEKEYNDLQAIVDMLEEEENIPFTLYHWHIENKKEKVKRYREYSKNLGRVE